MDHFAVSDRHGAGRDTGDFAIVDDEEHARGIELMSMPAAPGDALTTDAGSVANTVSTIRHAIKQRKKQAGNRLLLKRFEFEMI